MASLNTSSNGPSIKSSYQSVVNAPPASGPAANSPTYGIWAIFSVSAPLITAFQPDAGGKESVLKVQSTGEGELVDLIEDFSEGRVQFAFVKIKDPNTTLPKNVLIGWCGEGVPERTKGYFTSHLNAVSTILHGYHVQIIARSDRDLTPESIVQKVSDASGAKYSGGSTLQSSSGPLPPIASKPAFNPTVSSGTSSFKPLASRTRPGFDDKDVDHDGWGKDAPEVTRSQLEKVQSAYQPTKVNMAELTKQKPESSWFNGSAPAQSGPEVIRGAYEPVGKVDIAALRSQSRQSADDRPTIVKGAYEPVGKVDIAAIRARAQKPGDDGARRISPAATGLSSTSNPNDEISSFADRSAALTQTERLTTLPKPKVTNKFGSSASSFAGTKAPAPGGFGVQSTTPAPAPVGAASRTFADEGGKTPAQIWAEKKARERGTDGVTSNSGVMSPVRPQVSGGGEWKSGYTGKSWAPVATTTTGHSASSLGQQKTGEDQQVQEAPSSPSGGIGALRDRFAGGTPMGAPSTSARSASPPPPPIPTASRPTGGVAMPGLPTRPRPNEDEEDRSIPPPPAVPRSPTPETPEREASPVRVAMPVARSAEPTLEPPQERLAQSSMPIASLADKIPQESALTDEHSGRAAGTAVAEASFGEHASQATAAVGGGGKRALILYDYEKAEDNEVELVEGQYVTNIEMVDEDWWMGTNGKGESGLFPSNYVEVVEDNDENAGIGQAAATTAHEEQHEATPAGGAEGPSATAQYDYEAAEDNELSFPEGATITAMEFPDEDWWFGHYGGKSGLFPANYVQLAE